MCYQVNVELRYSAFQACVCALLMFGMRAFGGDQVVPGELVIDPPTFENLGFRWFIEGDDNRNASVSVSYREREASLWKTALPMLRVHHDVANKDYEPYRTGNLFAGSVLFLKAGTNYDVRFLMKDPDGEIVQTEGRTIATSSVPGDSGHGRTLHVYPRDFKGERIADSVLGLMNAYGEARGGDIVLLHSGVYKAPFVLRRSGDKGNPIVFRGEKEGQAFLEGPDRETYILDIREADHLAFENLTFRKGLMAINAGKRNGPGTSGLIVRGCRIEDVIYGIYTTSEQADSWLISDNVITGINPTWYPRPQKTYMSPAHTGVNLYGRGHVVRYNRISRFSDALAIANFGPPMKDVRMHCVAIDFHNNDLSFAQDDGIEADYGCHNVRVYRNRISNAHTGLSAQPFYGGPCYFIRNEMYAITSLPLKLHNYCTGLEIYHNTCVSARQGFQSFHKWQNGLLFNNLFLGGARYAMETGSITPYTRLDHNGYRQNESVRFLKWFDGSTWGRYPSVEAFYRATGHEKHGIRVDYDIFVNARQPVEGKTYIPGDAGLQLKKGAPAVDAGKMLPNVNDVFTGKAPDLGCYEQGTPLPHYGPR